MRTDRTGTAPDQPAASENTQLIRQLTDVFGRLGLQPAPDHVKAVAEYHGRWTEEMAALRLRLEQQDTSPGGAGANDLI